MSKNNNKFEENYSNSLFQLQQSLNGYLDSIEQLLGSIEKNPSLDEVNKKTIKKQISTTITTLLEVQKIVYKKIKLLVKNWDIESEINFDFIHQQDYSFLNDTSEMAIEKKLPYNMKKYHQKKEYPYRTVIYYENTKPALPWRSDLLNK